MLAEGLNLTVVGMVIVFIFLIILVLVMNLISRVLKKSVVVEGEAETVGYPDKVSLNKNTEIAIAIAAIKAFTRE